ncbi:MAG: glycoside hydrolase family 127 protein, partial [Clostridia bacterium]|nr:glycoside hydrolase family 127 protein [Clostridia bacterium]
DARGPLAEAGEYGGLPVIEAAGWQRPAPDGSWLYRPYAAQYEKKTLTFIPYYAFANRGESDMRVWVPVRAMW